MAVTKRTRFEVFKRDGFTCAYCGRTPPNVILEADHIVAVSDGGPDAMENLVTACFDCNRGKSNIPLTSVSKPLAEVMEEAAEKREQLAAYNLFLLELRAEQDAVVERLGVYWYDKLVPPRRRGTLVFSDIRAQSIRTFLQKLPTTEVMEAIDIAHARVRATAKDDEKMWKYFCGICWTKIKRLRGEA